MDFVYKLFSTLPDDIEYAIERGIDKLTLSSEGDLDVLVKKSDFLTIADHARSSAILVSLTITYGGARLFLSDNSGNIKRVDFDWLIHHKGFPLRSVDDYIKHRYKDTETGLYLLPEKQHASVINYIKNSKGAAEKYRQILEKHNFQVFDKNQHLSLMLSALVTHPIMSSIGVIRYLACYLLRAIYPTGLLIYGLSGDQIANNKDVMYLFQNRISRNYGIKAYLDTHFLSRICITKNAQLADITINFTNNTAIISETIIQYLRLTRTRIPKLLFKLA